MKKVLVNKFLPMEFYKVKISNKMFLKRMLNKNYMVDIYNIVENLKKHKMLLI